MRERREWNIKWLTVRCADSFNTVSVCVPLCMHVCVFNTKCCQVDAPGKLLSSNPGAPGHCKTLTVSWCCQGIVWLCLCRSLYLWAVATVCHIICVYLVLWGMLQKCISPYARGRRNGGSCGRRKKNCFCGDTKYPLEIAMSLLWGCVCPYQVGGKNLLFFFFLLHFTF